MIDAERTPININVSCNQRRAPSWMQTPDLYPRHWNKRHDHDHFSGAQRCYGGGLNAWYRTNQMRDLDPTSDIDGDRIYLTGRRWRAGMGNPNSMTSTMVYPDQIPQSSPANWLMNRPDPQRQQTTFKPFAPYAPYGHVQHASPEHFSTATPHRVDQGKYNFDRVVYNRN
jgi:hypothetical protein